MTNRRFSFPATAGLWITLFLGISPEVMAQKLRILDPEPGAYVSGEYEVVLQTESSDQVVKTLLLVDGTTVFEEQGWRPAIVWDFGETIEARRLQAIVETRSGEIHESAEVFTKALRVDFSETTRLMLLSAVVKSRSNKPITGLVKEDFRVSVNKQTVTIESFHKELLPLDLAVMLDSSSSLREQGFPELQLAATQFLKELAPSDQVLLYEFKNEPNRLSRFTTDRKTMVARIGDLKPSGGTALFDALLTGVDELKARRRGRRAIVLFTDGRDSVYESPNTKARLLRKTITEAQNHEVTIYTIGLGKKIHKPALERMAEETGGRFFFADKVLRLPQIFASIVEDLKNQYILGIPPRQGMGFQKIDIKVRKRGAVVFARKGFSYE